MHSKASLMFSDISVWMEKLLENASVDGEHFKTQTLFFRRILNNVDVTSVTRSLKTAFFKQISFNSHSSSPTGILI